MDSKDKKPYIKEDYLSPRWSGEIADCSLPLTIDTYSNCSFGCVYCFSQYQRGTGSGKEAYLNKNVRCIPIEKTKRILSGQDQHSQKADTVRRVVRSV